MKEYPGDKVTGPTYNVNSAGVSLYIPLSPQNDFVGIFFAIYQRNIIQLINLSPISKRISFGKNYWKNIHPPSFEIFENEIIFENTKLLLWFSTESRHATARYTVKLCQSQRLRYRNWITEEIAWKADEKAHRAKATFNPTFNRNFTKFLNIGNCSF